MSLSDPNDERLLRRVLNDQPKLLAIIRSVLPRADQAQDIFQDLCVLVLKKRPELPEDSHLSAWLRTAARRLALNAARKHENRVIQLGEHVHGLMDWHWQKFDSHSGSELAAALQECLRQLNPRARGIIEQRYGDGMSCLDLAERLGRPVATIYMTISRIHRKLGECILRRTTEEGARD